MGIFAVGLAVQPYAMKREKPTIVVLVQRWTERVRVNDCIVEHRFGVRCYWFGTYLIVHLLGNYCWVGFSLYSRVARK